MVTPPDARPPGRSLLVCIVTGEPSGDLLGARLMAALRRMTGGQVDFMGVGGESMAAAGLVSLVDQRDLAVMGFIEVVPRIPLLLRRVRQVTGAIMNSRPDVLITIDSWGFTKRVHRTVRKASRAAGWTLFQLHYVAPMVWAWKEKRARDVAATVDRLLCLLPNEPAYFRRHGLPADHVGHPVVEERAGHGDGESFRYTHGIAPRAPVLAVLPGSRRSETSRLLPLFGEAVAILTGLVPGLRVVVPTVATVAEAVDRAACQWPGGPVMVRGEQTRYGAFAAADVAMAASGTVSLELALAGVPHLTAYRVAPTTAWLLRQLTTLTHANLINLTLDRPAVPELLQEDCSVPNLTAAIQRLLADETARTAQKEAFAAAIATLGGGERSPSDRAARVVLDVCTQRKGGIPALSGCGDPPNHSKD